MKKNANAYEWSTIDRDYKDGVLVKETLHVYGNNHEIAQKVLYNKDDLTPYATWQTDTYLCDKGQAPRLWSRSYHKFVNKNGTTFGLHHYFDYAKNGSVQSYYLRAIKTGTGKCKMHKQNLT